MSAARNPLAEMGFEDDYAYQTGSSGSSTSHLDITRYALGARGIDRIEKVVDSTSSSPTTVIQYPLYDAHGNMVATLSRGSSTGTYTVGNQRAFEPWGSVFDSSGLSNTPKQAYCASLGHVADSELGLTYMRARYYEPGTGRFISEDPELDGWNWYAYANSDPIAYTDPSGENIVLEALGDEFVCVFNLAAAVNAGDIGGVVFWIELMAGTELSPAVVAMLSVNLAAAQRLKQSVGGLGPGSGNLDAMISHVTKYENILAENPNANLNQVLHDIGVFFQNWMSKVRLR